MDCCHPSIIATRTERVRRTFFANDTQYLTYIIACVCVVATVRWVESPQHNTIANVINVKPDQQALNPSCAIFRRIHITEKTELAHSFSQSGGGLRTRADLLPIMLCSHCIYAA